MTRDQGKPLRLFVDPFAAWRELAFKTAEMIAASVQAGAAASRSRVAVIDQREQPRHEQPRREQPERPRPRPKAAAKKKHKKRAKRR